MREKNDENPEKKIVESLDLQKALRYNRFHHFLFETKKYKHFLWSKEASFSFSIAVIITLLMWYVAFEDVSEALLLSQALIPSFIGGMLTILGLSLTGLAIVTSTLGEKFITIILRENKLYSILSILFNFYFSGFVIGLSIASLTFTYITLSISVPFNSILYLFFVFLNSYLVFFSVIYSVMLLGTCIRMFLVKYAIEKDYDSKKQ